MTHRVDHVRTEAMIVERPGTQVATRIGFAERWLHRARTQCDHGDVTGGMLTLALADAEVRYALEVGGWPPTAHPASPSNGRRLGGLVLAAVAAAVAAVWVSWSVPAPTGTAVDGPPFIRFSSNLGAALSSVAAPVPQAAMAQRLTAASTQHMPAAPRPATSRRATPRAARRTASAPAASAVPAGRTSGQTAAGTTVLPAAPAATAVEPVPVVSEAELIDMVLAASRALQGGAGP